MKAAVARRPQVQATVFEALASKVSPIVKHYRDDLNVHDQGWLTENPGVPFLHFARECGTHLWGLMPIEDYPRKAVRVPHLFGSADRNELVESLLSAVRYCVRSEVTAACHYFDGRKLREIEPAKAIEIVQDYACRIRREWNS
jgi:hypothetical protein